MSKSMKELVAEQSESWTGIVQPNEAAGETASLMLGSIKGYEALRGQLAFEDEPSSFEAALQETKEVLS